MVGCVGRKNRIRNAGTGGAKRRSQVVPPPIRSQTFGCSGEFVDTSFKFDVVRHGTVTRGQACRAEVLKPKAERLEGLGRIEEVIS